MDSIPFNLDSESKVKLYFQLFQKMTEAIINGTYAVGSKLPSVRDLSKDLHISRNTVNTAYKMLIDGGYVHSRAKSGYVVNKVENFAASSELLSDTIKGSSSQEESEIPTVTDVVKQREGSEIQRIPLPEDFSDILPTKTEVTSKKATVATTKSKVVAKESTKTAPKTSQKPISEQKPVVEVKPTSVPKKEQQIQQQEEPFGKKELRKAIARYVYDVRNISCTSGQVVVAETETELLSKAISCFTPETKISSKADVFPGKGLLRLAELAVQPKTETVVHEASFSNKAGSLYLSELPSSIQIKLFADDSDIDIAALEESNATVVVIAPQYKEMPLESLQKYEPLLAWANKSPDRYIIECDGSTQGVVFENPLVCGDKTNKVMYVSSIEIGRPLPYLILPPALLQKYRDRWSSEKCSLPEQIQTLAETAIPLKLLNTGTILN